MLKFYPCFFDVDDWTSDRVEGLVCRWTVRSTWVTLISIQINDSMFPINIFFPNPAIKSLHIITAQIYFQFSFLREADMAKLRPSNLVWKSIKNYVMNYSVIKKIWSPLNYTLSYSLNNSRTLFSKFSFQGAEVDEARNRGLVQRFRTDLDVDPAARNLSRNDSTRKKGRTLTSLLYSLSSIYQWHDSVLISIKVVFCFKLLLFDDYQ